MFVKRSHVVDLSRGPVFGRRSARRQHRLVQGRPIRRLHALPARRRQGLGPRQRIRRGGLWPGSWRRSARNTSSSRWARIRASSIRPTPPTTDSPATRRANVAPRAICRWISIGRLKPKGIRLMLYLPCQTPNAGRPCPESLRTAGGKEGPADRSGVRPEVGPGDSGMVGPLRGQGGRLVVRRRLRARSTSTRRSPRSTRRRSSTAIRTPSSPSIPASG